jgi:phage FluMu protein Com
MVEMKIRCPTCKNIILVQGNPQENICITCPKCNTHGMFTFPIDTSTRPPQTERNTTRPIGVTILALLAIIGALTIIFNSAFYVNIATLTKSSTSVDFFVIFILLLSIVLTVIFFMMAYGFWKGLRWSWFVAIGLLVILLTIQIIAAPLGLLLFSRASLSDIFDTVFFFTIIRSIVFLVLYSLIFILIIYYLTRPVVKTYFHIDQPRK